VKRRRNRRPLVAAAVGSAMVIGLLGNMPARAGTGQDHRPAQAQQEKPVASRLFQPAGTRRTMTGRSFAGAAPAWPTSGTAQVDLSAAGPQQAAGLPVRLERAAAGGGTPARLRVEILDRTVVPVTGPAGLLVRLSTSDIGGPVRMTVDYSAFRWTYGADWASRLRLVALPECALATPGARACRGRPLPTDNNLTAGTAAATIDLAAARTDTRRSAAAVSSGTLVALDAGASGPAGDYSATSLSSSGTWSAGGNSGDFSWAYPMRMPPSLGGPVPSVGLTYSSSSVDGRMAASNNQPSLVGEGFDWSAGAVERSYLPCGADRGNGANNTEVTGDECWLADNATLAMSGHAGELIKDESNPNRWRLRRDDGTFVEHRTGAGNGARDGEWWVATTTDGTQYWFGGVPAASSTLLVPVYGNHPGEPCHAATFAASSCVQAYRWNLDRVVDRHGNTMTYFYAKETNSYARNMNPLDLATYDRSSYPLRIEYGTRNDRAETAPMQVLFGIQDRCLSGCAAHDGTHYPDTPWDQECTATPCPVPQPTYWTAKRVTSVTTRAGTRDVERWTLAQSFKDPGDGTRAGLWLDRISHTGLVGGSTPLPDVTFDGVQLPNRVDTVDHSPPMNWWRVKTINTESGGKIDVTYSPQDCVAGSRIPDVNALQDNTLRCYPVRWTPPGTTGPVVDFFHKYVVTDVAEADLAGGAPRKRTHYDYLGTPAWHYTDDNGLVPSNVNKTWSVFRGYGAVRATVGDPGEQTVTETRFFRGMHGDHLPSGTRTVVLPAIAVGNVPAVNDEDVFAGMVRESITYNGPGGAEVTGTAYEPWQSAPTTKRIAGGITVYARYVQTTATHTRTARDGGRAPQTTTTVATFDDVFGMPISTEDRGDDAVAGDERCTLADYARNTTAWLVSTVSRQRVYAVDCAKAQAGPLTDDDVVGETRTYYDGLGLGAAPTKGEVTRTEEMNAYHNGAPSYLTTSTSGYDAYGRVIRGTDVRGRLTTTAFTPPAGGPVTGLTQVTNTDWTSTTVFEPAWGSVLSTVDSNGRKAELAYDGLGRLVSVWKPGRDRSAQQSPSIGYEYRVNTDAPSVVTSKTLNAAGGYVTTYTFYDSLLRTRQTQRPDAAGGPNAVVTDTYYDTVGRASRTNGSYLSTLPPGPTLSIPTMVVPTQTSTVYDGAGRTVASVFTVNAPPGGSPGGTEKWRTTTAYGGDRVDVTPPAGGIVTSTVVDVVGRSTELRQYHAGLPAGSTDPAGYDATRYTYDRKGHLVKVTDPAGNVWTYGFDFAGRQNRVVDPDKGTVDSVFNDAGDLVSSTDARNRTLAYSYDQMGRKTGLYAGSVAPANILARWEYDTLANGVRVNGKLVRSTRFVDGSAYVKEVTGYTVDYQPSSLTLTVPASEQGLAGNYAYVYTYNVDGSPKTQRMPAIGDLKQETLTFGYDTLGQPTTVDSGYGTSARTTLVASTGYTSFGEVGAYTLRNNGGNAVDVVRTFETDTRRLRQIWTTKQTAPTTIADVRYSYDPAGNVTRIAELTSGDAQCFRSDHLRRLTEAWTPASGDCAPSPTAGGLGGPARYWQTYGYDLLGNRTRLVEHATPAGDRTTTYTVPGGRHQLTATSTADSTGTTTGAYTYDPAGNMLTRATGTAGTQTMTWDAEGHLATSADATGATSFGYDADGGRLVRRDPAGRTLYLPGQELRFTTNGGVSTGTRYYSSAGNVVAVRSGAGLTWLSGDAQGTSQISIDAVSQAVSTRRQTPFGVPRNGTGTWPSTMDKGFVGGTDDNTGLTHLGAREYDPATGRFISRDMVVDTTEPQQMNGYAYADNAPVTMSDPTGLEPGSWCDTPACTQHDNALREGLVPPSTGGPPIGHGPCDGSHSASNCDRPASSYKGPCDGNHSAGNCEGPRPGPWDVVATVSYPNGTKLYIFRNGQAQINGFLLPDGVIDAEALARVLDRKRSRQTPPDDVPTTIAKLSEIDCHPTACTLQFYKSVNTLHQMIMQRAADRLPASGICVNAFMAYWVGTGLSECVIIGHHSTSIMFSTVDALSAPSASAGGSVMFISDPDVDERYCGPFDHRAGSIWIVGAGWDQDPKTGRVYDTYAGLQGSAGPPVNAEIGDSNTTWIVNFDDSGAHQIC
jgi:RHS repeat-associated protein